MVAIVRMLGPADQPAWRDLWAGYLDFYETTLPPRTWETTWARLHDPAVPMFGALAIDAAGQAVGLVHWLYHLSFWEVPERCYLNDLFVTPAARGSGAAEALIRSVYAHADARGGGQVWWLTAADNARARALYDRIGKPTPFVKYTR